MTIYLVYSTVALSETGRSIVEVLVGESIFLYVWCGNGVPTPLFLAIHSCLPATIFGQKFRSARNQMLFIDLYSCCV